MATIRDYATVSQKVFHAYADSTRPDDTGDGLTLATAKKTIEAAVTVLPDIAFNHVVLHLSGQFTLNNYIFIPTVVNGNNMRLVIDGGDEVDVVAGPFTATSGTTTSLTDTARSWTPNEHQGYAVEILDGAAAGYICTIQSNTSDTITVGRAWPAPGTPQYRIVRPATTITKGTASWFYFAGKVSHRVNFQRLRLIGSMYIGALYSSSTTYIELSDVIVDGPSGGGFSCSVIKTILWYSLIDPDNPSSTLSSTTVRRGVSYRGSSPYAIVGFETFIAICGPSVIPGTVSATKVGSRLILQSGALVKKLELFGTDCELGYNAESVTNPIITGSTDYGIDARDSRITVSVIDTDISANSSHGIKLDNSILEFIDAKLTGSGNGGAGVYAINGSAILAKDGQESTLTGTVGDISVDGATELMTWADVEAGTKADIIGEISVKKAV